jgi:hypothetical protein
MRADALATPMPQGAGPGATVRSWGWWGGLGIRGKVTVAFGIIVALMLIVGIVGWRFATRLTDEFTSLYQNHLMGTVHLANAESALWQLRYGFPQFLVLGPEERRRIVDEEPRWYGVIQENVGRYAGGALTPGERRALRDWMRLPSTAPAPQRRMGPPPSRH